MNDFSLENVNAKDFDKVHGILSEISTSRARQDFSSRETGTRLGYNSLFQSIHEAIISKKNNQKNILIKPLQLCIPGEHVCGNGYHIKNTSDETLIFVGDGLGQGPNVHEAVKIAIDVFKTAQKPSLSRG